MPYANKEKFYTNELDAIQSDLQNVCLGNLLELLWSNLLWLLRYHFGKTTRGASQSESRVNTKKKPKTLPIIFNIVCCLLRCCRGRWRSSWPPCRTVRRDTLKPCSSCKDNWLRPRCSNISPFLFQTTSFVTKYWWGDGRQDFIMLSERYYSNTKLQWYKTRDDIYSLEGFFGDR